MNRNRFLLALAITVCVAGNVVAKDIPVASGKSDAETFDAGPGPAASTDPAREAIRKRWLNMTPEEREEFRQEHRAQFREHYDPGDNRVLIYTSHSGGKD